MRFICFSKYPLFMSSTMNFQELCRSYLIANLQKGKYGLYDSYLFNYLCSFQLVLSCRDSQTCLVSMRCAFFLYDFEHIMVAFFSLMLRKEMYGICPHIRNCRLNFEIAFLTYWAIRFSIFSESNRLYCSSWAKLQPGFMLMYYTAKKNHLCFTSMPEV